MGVASGRAEGARVISALFLVARSDSGAGLSVAVAFVKRSTGSGARRGTGAVVAGVRCRGLGSGSAGEYAGSCRACVARLPVYRLTVYRPT